MNITSFSFTHYGAVLRAMSQVSDVMTGRIMVIKLVNEMLGSLTLLLEENKVMGSVFLF